MWLQFLTGSRVLVGAAAAILLTTWYPERWAIWVALGSVGLIELTDLLDGYLARRLGMASKFGAMFDPYADAVSRFLVYWGLSQAGYCAPYVVPVIAVRDITVAYLRTWLSVRGGRINARWSGKLKAAVLGGGRPHPDSRTAISGGLAGHGERGRERYRGGRGGRIPGGLPGRRRTSAHKLDSESTRSLSQACAATR